MNLAFLVFFGLLAALAAGGVTAFAIQRFQQRRTEKHEKLLLARYELELESAAAEIASLAVQSQETQVDPQTWRSEVHRELAREAVPCFVEYVQTLRRDAPRFLAKERDLDRLYVRWLEHQEVHLNQAFEFADAAPGEPPDLAAEARKALAWERVRQTVAWELGAGESTLAWTGSGEEKARLTGAVQAGQEQMEQYRKQSTENRERAANQRLWAYVIAGLDGLLLTGGIVVQHAGRALPPIAYLADGAMAFGAAAFLSYASYLVLVRRLRKAETPLYSSLSSGAALPRTPSASLAEVVLVGIALSILFGLAGARDALFGLTTGFDSAMSLGTGAVSLGMAILSGNFHFEAAKWLRQAEEDEAQAQRIAERLPLVQGLIAGIETAEEEAARQRAKSEERLREYDQAVQAAERRQKERGDVLEGELEQLLTKVEATNLALEQHRHAAATAFVALPIQQDRRQRLAATFVELKKAEEKEAEEKIPPPPPSGGTGPTAPPPPRHPAEARSGSVSRPVLPDRHTLSWVPVRSKGGRNVR